MVEMLWVVALRSPTKKAHPPSGPSDTADRQFESGLVLQLINYLRSFAVLKRYRSRA